MKVGLEFMESWSKPEALVVRVAAFMSLAFLCAHPSQAASFDCAKAETAVEKMICADPELSKMDETLAERYAEAHAQAAAVDVESIRSEQRAWLRDNPAACPDLACLKSAYALRIGVLERISWPVAGRGVPMPHRLPADLASVNCAKATSVVVKLLICSSGEYVDIDQRLVEFFAYALRYAPNPEALVSEQRAWVRDVRDSCRTQDCLGTAYRNRLAEVLRIGGLEPVDDSAFAVDQAAYAAKARLVLANLLANRQFKPFRLSPPDVQDQGMLLLQKLRSSDYEIVAPFEWSTGRPDLPTYMAARKRCTEYDFEFIRVGRGQLLRATENFGLYEISARGTGGNAERLLVYRAERYVPHWADWGRHRVRRDNEEMIWGGNFFIFTADGCIVSEPESFHRQVDGMARERNFSEIVKINHEYFIVNVWPVIETTYDNYAIDINSMEKIERERQTYFLRQE